MAQTLHNNRDVAYARRIPSAKGTNGNVGYLLSNSVLDHLHGMWSAMVMNLGFQIGQTVTVALELCTAAMEERNGGADSY